MIGEISEIVGLLRNRRLSGDELHHLQSRKLRAVCRHAYQRVPYYRTLFSSVGLHPDDIRSVDDLQRIPITTKNDLRRAPEGSIFDERVDRGSLLSINTTGSTGEPFTAYYTGDENRTRRVVRFRALLSNGFKPWDRLAVLGPGRPIASRLHRALGLFRGETVSIMLPLEQQVARLRELRPTILWAYPTPLRALVHGVGGRLSTVARPRALITSSEVFDPVTRERIRADLDPEMFNFYGSNEVGLVAWECRAHEGLHVNADVVILECLDGDRPAGPGEQGVAVITSLSMFAMPLLRYHVGDICAPLGRACSCGSTLPLIGAPLGRDDEMIQLPSGKVRSVRGAGFTVRDVPGIDRYRLIQHDLEHLTFQLAVRDGLSPDGIGQVRSRFLEYLGEPVRIDVEVVDALPDLGLKFKVFVSHLPPLPDGAHLDPSPRQPSLT